MYERVNINCAEVNSTRQMGSGIYFFISVIIVQHIKTLNLESFIDIITIDQIGKL